MEALKILSLIREHSQAPIAISHLKEESSLDQEQLRTNLRILEEQGLIQKVEIPQNSALFYCKTIFKIGQRNVIEKQNKEEEKKGQEEDQELMKLRAEWKKKSAGTSNNLRKSKNQYFKALREYNYLKDLAHGLAQILSEKRGSASKEILKEFEFEDVE